VGVVDTTEAKRLPAELERHYVIDDDTDDDDSSSGDDENIVTTTIQVKDTNDILSNSRMLTNSSPLDDSNTAASSRYSDFGPDVLRIARGAARLKRAEILAHTVLEYGRRSSKKDAGRLRGLLLSVMEDWRALAIRSVACLYRLEGILKQQQHEVDSSLLERTPQIVETAREALRVYAPLAQRLGLQRLKSRLEDRAFRILYQRQHRAVKALYREKGENMQVVSSYLEAQIASVLQENEELMDQLEELRVTSRVKEPYSLWKKLLRMRSRNPEKSTGALLHSSTKSSLTSSELSLLDVQDGVALRIVLRARKWEADETDEATRARERLLCYYVQHLLRKHWPVVDPSRIKDYIRFPKENGYQSLHYMSSITSEGEDWPFEVQVRSEEMHRIAEFGVAAHWDYKLGDKSMPLLGPSETATTTVEPLPPYAAAENKRHIPINTSASYIDALVTARRDLVQQKVFVFFAGTSVIRNKGQLLSLPVGARVCDAIEELEAQLDMDLSDKLEEDSIIRNGHSAEVNDFVTNGDVLLINL
jgi:GTP pyrophosphokinase